MLDERQYPRGPNGLADLCRDKLAELEALLPTIDDAKRAKAVRDHIAMVRRLERFAKTRAGYVKPEKANG